MRQPPNDLGLETLRHAAGLLVIAAGFVRSASAGRVVSIADLHGDWEHTIDLLSATGLAEEADLGDKLELSPGVKRQFAKYRGVRWTGGETILVQTGDIVDRGDFAWDLYELFASLRRQAPAHGGRVINLVGNHELMNMQGDFRYVSQGDTAQFGGSREREAAWLPSGVIGRQMLEEFEPLAVVEQTLFVHAGLPAKYVAEGLDGLQQALQRALRAAAERRPGHDDLLKSGGPFWVRRFAEGKESVICKELEDTLGALGAVRMVIGHTQVDEGHIRVRCNGKILMADTIISKDGYPMCWDGEQAAREGCEGARTFVEIVDGVASGVKVLGTGQSISLEKRKVVIEDPVGGRDAAEL